MIDKKEAALAYCKAAKRLEVANLVLQDAKKVVDRIYIGLEQLRNQIGKDLEENEMFVINLPENIAVVIVKNNQYTQVDIGKIL